jgi:hypothetical protein
MTDFPIMRGDAAMAMGASYFEVPLFSQVIDNLWQGCSPSEFPDVLEKYNYDLNDIRVYNDPAVIKVVRTEKPVKCKWLWEFDSFEGHVKPRFDFIMNLYPWGKYVVPEGTEMVEYAAFDGTRVDYQGFQDCADMVVSKLDADKKVLVHCQAGLNRSSFVIALVLMQKYQMSTTEAVNTIRSTRSQMCLCNDAFLQYLRGLDA